MHKIYYTDIDEPTIIKNTVTKLHLGEMDIVKHLEGIIHRPYIFSMCANISEVRYVYKNLFIESSNEDLDGYLRIDLSGYMAKVRTAMSSESKIGDINQQIGNIVVSNLSRYSKDDLDRAYEYLINLIVKDLKVYPCVVLFIILTKFVILVHEYGKGDLSQLKYLAKMCIVNTLNDKLLPTLEYSKDKDPALYVASTKFPDINSKLEFIQYSTADQLIIYWSKIFTAKEGAHYKVFDELLTYNFDLIATKITEIYNKPNNRVVPMATNVETFFKLKMPQRKILI